MNPKAVLVFFQAEDGIRDYKVTGVQTCALPISLGERRGRDRRDPAPRDAQAAHPGGPPERGPDRARDRDAGRGTHAARRADAAAAHHRIDRPRGGATGARRAVPATAAPPRRRTAGGSRARPLFSAARSCWGVAPRVASRYERWGRGSGRGW